MQLYLFGYSQVCEISRKNRSVHFLRLFTNREQEGYVNRFTGKAYFNAML